MLFKKRFSAFRFTRGYTFNDYIMLNCCMTNLSCLNELLIFAAIYIKNGLNSAVGFRVEKNIFCCISDYSLINNLLVVVDISYIIIIMCCLNSAIVLNHCTRIRMCEGSH